MAERPPRRRAPYSEQGKQQGKEHGQERRPERENEGEPHAHADGLKVPDLSGVPPAILVDTPAALADFLDDIEDADELAVDTEADSFYSFREKVCLIQVSYGDQDWLIDPLAGLDLTPLGEHLANPASVKIFHDGEFDVMVLKRTFGFQFANLFDTSVAAQAVGRTEIGLAAMLAAEFGLRLDKSQQMSDWSKRPLTERQKEYARLDTRYLSELRDRLEDELEAADRLAVHDGEVRRLEALEPPERTFDPDEFVRLKGVRGLDLAQQAVLRELFILRNDLAEQADRPPFQVVPHHALVELAQLAPSNEIGLARVRGMSPKLIRRYGKDLLAAIRHGRAAGPLSRSPKQISKDGTEHLDDWGRELFERLKRLRTQLADKHGMSAALVLNRRVLPKLAELRPRQATELERVEGLLDWQKSLLGKDLVQLIDGFERGRESGELELPRHRRRR